MDNNKKTLGVGVRNITPQWALPLAGFAHRLDPIAEVASPLYLKCFYFTDGSVQTLIINADLIWWGNALVKEIKKAIGEKWGVAESSILLHGTHTHCGPQTSVEVSEELGKVDFSYLDFLKQEVLQGVADAYEDREEVVIDHFSYGVLEPSIHRRKSVEGMVHMLPNEAKKIDKTLQICGFYRTSSLSLKALWLFGECHPTVSDLTAVSSEYPGALTEFVEEHLPCETVAFFQGSCGDIRPALVCNGEFYKGTFAEIEQMGKETGQQILRGVEERIPQYQELDLASSWKKQPLFLQNGDKKELLIQRQQICKGFDLLAVNAEIVQDYRLQLVRDSLKDQRIWLLGYSNGMIGYIGTSEQILEGGYEGQEFCKYFNLPAPFMPDIERIVREELKNIVNK